MNLYLDNEVAFGYHSGTQIARVVTENWVASNMYCPRCGNAYIKHFENNRPVADFFCPKCNSQYELKSKNGSLGSKINDGAYETMIARITSNQNPDFFFLSYSKTNLIINNFIFIPKHFFIPNIIEKRNPLAPTAHRAGWVGCNILIDKIPTQGKISIISNGIEADHAEVVEKVNKISLLEVKDINSRNWLMDILHCVNQLDNLFFTLDEVYSFENELKLKHPQNNNIKPKIRQQLQLMRDRGFIEFLGNGKYRKIL